MLLAMALLSRALLGTALLETALGKVAQMRKGYGPGCGESTLCGSSSWFLLRQANQHANAALQEWRLS